MEKLAYLYKLTFYVPESHLETVKNALFDTGAGKYDRYDKCCWQCLGQGQFRPLNGSNPTIGNHGELVLVQEYKVEMICKTDIIVLALDALKANHPYEEPAFAVIRLEQF